MMMATGPVRPGNRAARAGARRVVVAGLISASLTIAGCGGGSRAARDAQAAARVRADQAKLIARQAGLGPDVGDFLARAAGASGQRYSVVYSAGAGQQTTVISSPPDRRLDVQGASGADSLDRFIVTGGKSYACHRSRGRWSCSANGSAGPSGGFTSDAITQTVTALTQISTTYGFAVSRRAIAGQEATCLAVDRRSGQQADPTFGNHAVLCIATNGVILEEDGTGSPLRAVRYESSVPAGAFSLPARPS